MKKIVALLLAVLYISTTSGVVLNVHYCMGKVSSVEVDNFKSAFCKCGKKLLGSSCCRSEIKVLKLSNDHKATLAASTLKFPSIVLSSPVSLINLCEVNAHSPVLPVVNAPPGISVKTYIDNCVFRI